MPFSGISLKIDRLNTSATHAPGASDSIYAVIFPPPYISPRSRSGDPLSKLSLAIKSAAIGIGIPQQFRIDSRPGPVVDVSIFANR
jgi:hypothetical protein